MSGIVVFDHKCDPPRELDGTPNPKAGDTIFVCECLCRWKAVSWDQVDNGLEFSPVVNVEWELFIGREVVQKETKTVMVREVLVEPDEFTYPSSDLLGDLQARSYVMNAMRDGYQTIATGSNTTMWYSQEFAENEYQYERLYTPQEAKTRALRRARNKKDWQKFHPPVQERKRT